MFTLDTPLARIAGIGPGFLAKLKHLGVATIGDLLYHFPTRYEDFSQIYRIADLEPGQHATIQGTVEEITTRRTWQKHFIVVEATVRDDSGSTRIIWFNQPYIKNILRPGRLANFSGKVAVSQDELYLSHPTFEPVSGDARDETRHTARLVPIYPETRGLTSKGIRYLIQPILKGLARPPEWLPGAALRMNRLPELHHALQDVHFPERIEDALAAKRRFAFEDLFLLQLENFAQKMKLARTRAVQIKTDIPLLKRIIAELPFALTASQKRSLWEILQDLEKGRPMNRLLQGDVGSGKTVVAALAAISAAENGRETAIMAPTEVLARQHFETFKKLFSHISAVREPKIALMTASDTKLFYENGLESPVKKGELREKVRRGEIPIVIGTHALLEESVRFKSLGLVVIDEQHRFGVEQRAALSRDARSGRRAKATFTPHFLSMSATPIPRTLMLTVFGDLDISTITELPAGRKNIVTKIVAPENRPKAYEFIREQIARGRQAFVICPRIEKPEQDGAEKSFRAREWSALEVKSVKEEFEKLSTTVFPDLRVAMLHGQMPASSKTRRGLASGGKPNKEQVMRDFKDGATDVLVSTSVIEVGVDVPNAVIMMIEGAERFGLAQLYQFRGRVGRGEHQSFCFLFTESGAKSTHERLRAIVEAKNGFELAEIDLKLRGPGEFLGERQTGLPDIAMRGLQDVELIKASRASALRVIQEDQHLNRYPALQLKLAEFQKKLHLE
ncbi:MAG: ATP-dependent DNA helicase RecG [Candidatus Liptonbacteria bacterium RIFCSPLOWO2_01_FULL_56_20]|uniref:Probable DNA 3'-5' helicase RecG n=1 Tax=Candidatus Liptonbacteria bacterium RIFCSPLOWO2_01_FULL_56_20 TaxID=1798652 RepID=A0A1G2CLP6_9BACT|nr:MAG: ATP-dependent DNA helicase RecG [Candidatus Liptonbacteria bacterium RIFCSPLOWO2_01_FULL_56_20]